MGIYLIFAFLYVLYEFIASSKKKEDSATFSFRILLFIRYVVVRQKNNIDIINSVM